jgi:hypothetical protein
VMRVRVQWKVTLLSGINSPKLILGTDTLSLARHLLRCRASYTEPRCLYHDLLCLSSAWLLEGAYLQFSSMGIECRLIKALNLT